jgi:type IV secretory pathway TrbF-like protein
MMDKAAAVHPAIDPRRTYNDRVSEALSTRFLLSTLTLLSLMIALAAVGGLVYVAAQSKFVPYVFEKSCGPALVPAGAARRIDAADPAEMKAWTEGRIADFVFNARLVTADAAHQQKAIGRVYAFLSAGDSAFMKLSEWYRGDEGAMQRAERETVAVEISSVLAQSDDTYQVDWTEHVFEPDGTPKTEFRMRAILRIYRRTPTRETQEEELRENPFGLFIKDYSWGRQL